MSEWFKVEDDFNVSVDNDGEMLDVMFDTNYQGTVYVEIPIEFVRKALKDYAEVQLKESNK